MKLFSRTSLVALGTAAAITLSGVTAPAFADEVLDTDITANAAETTEETTTPQPVVEEALKLQQPPLVTGNVGTPISPVTVEVTSGVAESFKASALPSGLFIDNDGVITGTPKKEFSGSTTITATSPDGKEATVNVNFSIDEKLSSGSSDTDNINDWIKIITAVIGALTTILTFSTKLDTFFK
ncbi:putative Ig domain-containing protein [Corynebacterium glutamicum]|uniref:putative Ig domain-containing protein n=1 Tax=Corynebacterium glutamicum TaxID=1718 RepID=UPI000744C507|nr:putative Ig domain-containing protein [Corynebacterium glutamicum]AMA00342.1 hypothetical protein APT58_08925 [Corynebacterium glutamicum]